MPTHAFGSPDEAQSALAAQNYLADRSLATAVFLAGELEQPLLLEGEAGVGKTEAAKALAGATGARLIRLQCHEGMDLHNALYDWDYPRQLLALRAAEGGAHVGELFSRDFLLRRPLLEALEHEGPVVLLIDEVDRADDEFEAFLLEFLSDFQVSVPELGTVVARGRPLVVLTSNRTRELHDALKRRCLYHCIDYPTPRRAALCARHCDLEVLHAAFEATFGSRRLFEPPRDPVDLGEGAKLALPRIGIPAASAEPAPLDEELVPAAWSDVELLRTKDFAELTDSERAAARRLVRRIATRG